MNEYDITVPFVGTYATTVKAKSLKEAEDIAVIECKSKLGEVNLNAEVQKEKIHSIINF